ncbi:MAG TPA: hypothetical protein VHC49_22685 [Mycobacteriales bacterium]|nr:hypothetical protein [Mycobacteriales bacterium]
MGQKRGIFAMLLICAALVAGCSDSSGGSSGDQKKDTSSSDSSDTTVGKDDLYAAGCPLLDSGLGTVSLVRKGVAAGLDKIRKNTDLTKEHDQWLRDAKDLLQNKDPNDAPGSVRSRVKKACADHGHPLDNLK